MKRNKGKRQNVDPIIYSTKFTAEKDTINKVMTENSIFEFPDCFFFRHVNNPTPTKKQQ